MLDALVGSLGPVSQASGPRFRLSRVLQRAQLIGQKQGFYVTGVDGRSVMLCCVSYFDNCFSVSHTPAGAVNILKDLELSLQSDWDLTMKPTSRSYVKAQGGCRAVVDELKWAREETVHARGQCIQRAGSIREDWSKTKRQM